jgi:hypothetical protein
MREIEFKQEWKVPQGEGNGIFQEQAGLIASCETRKALIAIIQVEHLLNLTDEKKIQVFDKVLQLMQEPLMLQITLRPFAEES